MAHSLSAQKRVRQNIKRNVRNKHRKAEVKEGLKEFTLAVGKADVATAEKTFRAVVSTMDKVASKSTIHKKTAARKRSRLAKKLNVLKAGKAKKA